MLTSSGCPTLRMKPCFLEVVTWTEMGRRNSRRASSGFWIGLSAGQGDEEIVLEELTFQPADVYWSYVCARRKTSGSCEITSATWLPPRVIWPCSGSTEPKRWTTPPFLLSIELKTRPKLSNGPAIGEVAFCQTSKSTPRPLPSGSAQAARIRAMATQTVTLRTCRLMRSG